MRYDSTSGLTVLSPAQTTVGRDADETPRRALGFLSSVQVANSYQLGGAGRVFAELSRFLPAAGVRFVGAVAEPMDVAALSEGRVELFSSATSAIKTRLWAARRTLLHMIESERPDILASHFALYAAPLLDRLCRKRSFAFVNHFHGPWAAESVREGAGAGAAAAKKGIEWMVYHRADRTIVLSHAFARIAADQYGISEDRIRIVPGSVDTQRFNTNTTRQQARKALFLPPDRPLLVTIRRLVNRMGLHTLVEAMRTVSRVVPDALMLIAGSGPLRDSLNSAVVEFDLQEHVRLIGFVPDEQLPLLYRAADLNVVPSQVLEGFGLVAVEALAAGTPSLVTPVGGLPEIVSSLDPALVLPSTSSQEMAARLIEILTGKHRLPNEAACRQFVLRNYTSELMARRTAQVYRELA